MSQPPPEPPRDHVFAGMNEDPDISTDPEKPGIDSAERVISNLPIDNSRSPDGADDAFTFLVF